MADIIEHVAMVRISLDAQRQLDRLPKTIRLRLRAVFLALSEWPRVSGVKPLRGAWAGHFRKRTGDYRVIFRVQGETVLIERIGDRRDVYEE